MAMNPVTQLSNPDLTNIPYKVRKFLEVLVKSAPLYSVAFHEGIPSAEGLSALIWGSISGTPNFNGSAPGQQVAGRTLDEYRVQINTLTYSDAIILSKVFMAQSAVKAEDMALSEIKFLAAQVVEYVIRAAIDSFCTVANVNLYTAASVSGGAVGSITASDVLTWPDLQKQWARFDAGGIRKYDEEIYKVVLHSAARFQLQSQATTGVFGYYDAHKYSDAGFKELNGEGLRPDVKGYVNRFDGWEVYSTPLMTVGNDGAGGIAVAYSAAFGDQGVGCVDLELDSSTDKGFNLIELDGNGIAGVDSTAEIVKSIAYRFTMGAQVLSQDNATANLQRVVRIATPTNGVQ